MAARDCVLILRRFPPRARPVKLRASQARRVLRHLEGVHFDSPKMDKKGLACHKRTWRLASLR